MSFPVTINPAVPPDSETPQAGALRIRNLTQALADLFGLPTAPQTITGPLFQTDTNGNVTVIQGAIGSPLTNKTGTILSPGEVVSYDATNDAAVALSDFAGGLVQYAVSLATVAVNAVGQFATQGVVQTLGVTGAVVRGHYLQKSATTKVAEDTGVLAATATPAPSGAFALALTAAAGPGTGSVAAYLLGATAGGTSNAGARVYRTTNQNIPTGVATAISFNSVRYNIGTLWSVVNPTRLTAPVGGRYLIGADIQWVAAITARIRVRINGTTIIARSNSDDQAGDLNTVYQLAAGEYAELQAVQSTGSTQVVSAAPNSSPEFYMQLLSA